jgi:hypothetical protein
MLERGFDPATILVIAFYKAEVVGLQRLTVLRYARCNLTIYHTYKRPSDSKEGWETEVKGRVEKDLIIHMDRRSARIHLV